MDDSEAATVGPLRETVRRDRPPRAGLVGGITAKARMTALIVATALFMENLDSTVVSTALPSMAHAFGAAPVHMNVALTSYLLALAAFIPASGWMADRFGARNVFRVAIVVFTLGSIACGAVNSLPELVLARILQGAGGAMMVPVGRLLLLRSVAKSEVVAAMAWLTMPALIGPLVGPPVGGFIVTWFSWRWVFDINIPIGVLGVLLVTYFVEDVREDAVARFDRTGFVLSGVAMAATMFGMETLGRGVVAPVISGAALVLGGGTIAGYAWNARRSAAPLLDLSLFRIPTFMVSTFAGTLFRIGVGAVPFLLPMMLQIGFGLSALQSGMITFAGSAGALVMKPAAVGLLRRLGFRTTLVWNGVLSTASLAIVGFFRPSWPLLAIYAALLLGGFLRSLQFTAFNSLAYADIPRERMSAATSLYATIQQLSLTIGVSAGAAMLAVSMAVGGHAQPELPDFTAGFLGISCLMLLASPAALLMPRAAGREMSGHRARAE
ncbi:MAG: MFS transporter [Rhodospirillales bacterium]|nr:MFS transporter [Rhodospirillales bacterium]